MRRCGWSVFSGHFDAENNLVRSAWAFGPLPTRVQATPTAELYALYMYLRHAAPFEGLYIFHSDCSYVVDGWISRCRSQLVSGWNHCCSLWTRIYELADEIGEEAIRVVKVKAHQTLRQDM